MKAKHLAIVLGIAALAIPAVSASQPSHVKLSDLAVTAAPVTADLAQLLADPRTNGDLSITLPMRFTTLEWINQSPFDV